MFWADVGVAEQGRLVRGQVQKLLESEGCRQPLGAARQAERRDERARAGPKHLVQELAESARWSAGHRFMVA